MLNLAMILRNSAQRNPGHTALILDALRVDYRELHALAQKFAGGLLELGLERGQHVALMLPNTPQFPVAYYGAHYAGNPVVPLNVMLTADELAYYLEDSQAAALVVWQDYLPQAKAAVERLGEHAKLIVVEASPGERTVGAGEISFAALMAGAEPLTELADTSPNDTAVILYTSGTTGRPKGAELTHFSMFYNAEYAGTKILPPDPGGVLLCTLPLFHSFGQTSVMNATVYKGDTLVMLPKFDATAALEAMQRHKVTIFKGVPTMYFALLNHPDASRYDLSSLRYAVSGGSPLPVEVLKAFEARYQVTVLEGYGLSETSPVASINVRDRPTKPGSIGLPLEFVEFKLVDDRDREIHAAGVRGEICIKGVNVMKGYLNRPDATAQAIKNGWFYTGDIGTRDEDGYYYIVDRKKDMIIRGGYNVYPREIEEVLFKHPAIAEAAVIGVKHERHGEEVKAVVVLKPNEQVTQEALIAFCKQHLAAFKYPRIVEFRTELPKGPTGKILKRELRG